ncbi:HLA-B associated transcript 1 [Suillus cothurnatus]|nr:HLA-B associated transcript 1 [Suillus cothurnatus]
MSSHDNEELIDYEHEHDVIPNDAVLATSTNGATASAADGEGDKNKKKFTGIHATGFRDFVWTPELLRAVGPLGFEHSLSIQQQYIPQANLTMDVLYQAKSGRGRGSL